MSKREKLYPAQDIKEFVNCSTFKSNQSAIDYKLTQLTRESSSAFFYVGDYSIDFC